MKTIWLVYESSSVVRNQFFIDQWNRAAGEQAADLHTVLYEDLLYGIKAGQPYLSHNKGLDLPDAAVMRLNQPLLSAQFELLGIPAFNNSVVARICNDKRLTHQYISGITQAMDTIFLRGDETDSPLPYPVVVKSVHGCGGRQVFLARDRQAFQTAMDTLRPNEALVQSLCDTPGKDVRAYVLGKEIVAVMMRYSAEDFRSNIGQGGKAVPYELSSGDEEIVRQIISMFEFGLVGIDVEQIIFELKTDTDIDSKIIEFLCIFDASLCQDCSKLKCKSEQNSCFLSDHVYVGFLRDSILGFKIHVMLLAFANFGSCLIK